VIQLLEYEEGLCCCVLLNRPPPTPSTEGRGGKGGNVEVKVGVDVELLAIGDLDPFFYCVRMFCRIVHVTHEIQVSPGVLGG